MIEENKFYDVSFKLASFNTEGGCFALFSLIPQIKETTYTFEGLSDERFRELEHMLNSVGVSLIHVTKTRCQSSAIIEQDETEDTSLFGCIDDLLSAREKMYSIAKDKTLDEDMKVSETKIALRDFKSSIYTLLKEIKMEMIKDDNRETDDSE